MRYVSAMALMLCAGSVVTARLDAQDRDLTTPAIEMVSSIGCAARDGARWTITRASEPVITEFPFSTTDEIEAARGASLGSRTYALIGVTEFLPPEELLDRFQRAEFTATESVNSTGALVSGHRILVKGLFIEHERINLTSVIDLADDCG